MFARLFGLDSISPADLHKRIEQHELVFVFDVNSPQSWAAGHVPGARHLDPAGPAEADLPADKDSLLVFYCSGYLCRKAPNAARRAKDIGYRNVHVMSAGISGWQSARLPTESA